MLVFGASGSGKSVLLSQFLNQINTYSKKYNDKRHYIITDVKPEFVGKFAKSDDYIFVPLINVVLVGQSLTILMIFQITTPSPLFYLSKKMKKIHSGD
nr:type IV secretion system DNA-binding domain-containing protein [Veillonella sp. VA137]